MVGVILLIHITVFLFYLFFSLLFVHNHWDLENRLANSDEIFTYALGADME